MIKLIWLIVVSVVAIVASPYIGDPLPASDDGFIFWQLRLPRTLKGIMVGSVLGLTGAAFQCLFGNPLATPSTTGTTAGASLGALFAITLLPAQFYINGWELILAAFIGALSVAFPVALFARKQRARLEDILLAGVALTLAAGALTTGLQSQAAQDELNRAVQWALGSLGTVGYNDVSMLAPVCGACIYALISQSRGLEALLAGEDRAFSQGVNVAQLRTWILTIGSLGVAASVAICGPIAFVGLVVPHLIRLSISANRRILLPTSALGGAAFLCVCDSIARLQELPVGVITASVGSPLLIWLILSRSR